MLIMIMVLFKVFLFWLIILFKRVGIMVFMKCKLSVLWNGKS